MQVHSQDFGRGGSYLGGGGGGGVVVTQFSLIVHEISNMYQST